MVPPETKDEFIDLAKHLPSIQLSERSVCDLEMLAAGAFSPLDRFMGREDFLCVQADMRLHSGHVFPIPVTLPIEASAGLGLDRQIALRDAKNDLLAVMSVEEIYEWDLNGVAQQVLGTTASRHPLVAEMHRWGRLNISGRLQVIQLPSHRDFLELRLTPSQTRARLRSFSHPNVVAFQPNDLLLRPLEDQLRKAAGEKDAILFLHAAVGTAVTGDVNHCTRVRAYTAVIQRYFAWDQALLALAPLCSRFAGPREALWQAVVRRNYGANYILVGPDDHYAPEALADQEYHKSWDARRLLNQYSGELGVGALSLDEDDSRLEYHSVSARAIGEEFLDRGRPVPKDLLRPEVANLLFESYPPRHRQGFCVWFTGLSGAGKSTTAEILAALLQERGRQVTVLDGDVVRTHLSKGLGFSKEDRDTNILRIGFVASEIVRHGGGVLCAAVSPYRATRDQVRAMVGTNKFVEVFVDTPIDVCEGRDTKGMYGKARRGEIRGFTGVDDPYEAPLSPELVLDTVNRQADDNARQVLTYLVAQGFVHDLIYPRGRRGSAVQVEQILEEAGVV